MRVTGISKRELATVLFALRNYQSRDIDSPAQYVDLIGSEHFTEELPLNPDEVDELCERLNMPINLCIDHIDGDVLNNDPANLRIVTPPKNKRNHY